LAYVLSFRVEKALQAGECGARLMRYHMRPGVAAEKCNEKNVSSQGGFERSLTSEVE